MMVPLLPWLHVQLLWAPGQSHVPGWGHISYSFSLIIESFSIKEACKLPLVLQLPSGWILRQSTYVAWCCISHGCHWGGGYSGENTRVQMDPSGCPCPLCCRNGTIPNTGSIVWLYKGHNDMSCHFPGLGLMLASTIRCATPKKNVSTGGGAPLILRTLYFLLMGRFLLVQS